MRYLLGRYPAQNLQFVDGWIGKGAILTELRKVLADYPDVSTELAVLSDPAGLTTLCGTHEDFLIPSSCLNSTVSGLISRTVLRDDLIGIDAVSYTHLDVYKRQIQSSFAGCGFNGDALHPGFGELPGFLTKVRITGDHIERALQRAFAFFLSDDGGMRRDIDRTIEADRAAALSFCHKKIPSCPG